MKTLQENIRTLRSKSHMTQNNLSELLGVSFQTISKWENGNSLPDITLLPLLAKTFNVSVYQLLGIIPIDYETYTHRLKNSSAYRDHHLEQFLASRQLYWNDDYLEFILSKALKITKPVKVAELNCGNGIFAKQLLKYLPEGSSYAGYEKSPTMREQGLLLFQDNTSVKFYPFDETETCKEAYDMVISQGYLRHHNIPLEGISLMKAMTKTGGLILCHEENRPFENTGLLLGDTYDTSFEKRLYLEKMWQKELEEGRDYRIGLRLPLLFDQLNLKNINTRLNDHVDFLLGDSTSKEQLELLNTHYKITSIDENNFFAFLLERGLSSCEAHMYMDLYQQRKSYMNQGHEQVKMVHCMGLVLTWATK